MVEIGLAAVINALGLLSAVIVILISFKPGISNYLRDGVPSLKEIDDIIDAVLLTLSASQTSYTVDNIWTQVLKELKKTGYKITSAEKRKIKNRLKAKLRRTGARVGEAKETEDYKIKLKE